MGLGIGELPFSPAGGWGLVERKAGSMVPGSPPGGQDEAAYAVIESLTQVGTVEHSVFILGEIGLGMGPSMGIGGLTVLPGGRGESQPGSSLRACSERKRRQPGQCSMGLGMGKLPPHGGSL